MQFVEIIDAVIRDHPFIDFQREHKNNLTEHWTLCPCGYSTRHFKTQRSAHKEFKRHIVDEINEALIEEGLLVTDTKTKANSGSNR